MMVKRRQQISLDSLRLLEAVATYGSFARAAEALCVVTSTITHAVRGLEDDLGLQLFDRSGRQVRFTAAGRTVLERGRAVLAQADALDEDVQRLATGWPARLAISVDEVLPIEPVMLLVRDFFAESPDTALSVQREAAAGSWDALMSGRADLVVGAPAEGPLGGGHESRPLCTMHFVCVVAADHPLASREGTVTSADLAEFRSIVMVDTSRALPRLPVGLQGHRMQMAVPDEAAKLEALRLGLGCGFLPRAMAQPLVASGELKVLEVESPRPTSRSTLAWRAGEGGRAVDWWVQRLTSPDVVAQLGGEP